MHEDNKEKQFTAILSGVVNLVLVVIKLVVGLYSGSVSIISEAAHSFVDVLASLLAFFAVNQSGKPVDFRHAYGHGKVENIAGAIEAFLVVGAAIWIIYESVDKITAKQIPEYLEYGIGVMLVSVVANFWITKRLYQVAERTGSSALKADALHHEADVWTSVGVLAGLVLIKLTKLYWLDPAVAIGVAMIIFKAGYTMTTENLRELMDVRLPPEDEEIILQTIKSFDEVIDIHRLRTRKSGNCNVIDMHLVLDKEMKVSQVYELNAKIKSNLEKKLGICDTLIHIEPDHCSPSACPLRIM